MRSAPKAKTKMKRDLKALERQKQMHVRVQFIDLQVIVITIKFGMARQFWYRIVLITRGDKDCQRKVFQELALF